MSVALLFPEKILRNSQKTVTFKEISHMSEQGYTQVAADGTRNKRDSWNVTWGALTLTEKNALEALFDTNGTHTVYTWTPSYESTSKKFKLSAEGYTITVVNNSSFSISCKLEEIFNLG